MGLQLGTVVPRRFDPFCPGPLQTADPQPWSRIHISRLPTAVVLYFIKLSFYFKYIGTHGKLKYAMINSFDNSLQQFGHLHYVAA